eukprot:15365184-Ditylum_brightwellii.AAC.1
MSAQNSSQSPNYGLLGIKQIWHILQYPIYRDGCYAMQNTSRSTDMDDSHWGMHLLYVQLPGTHKWMFFRPLNI